MWFRINRLLYGAYFCIKVVNIFSTNVFEMKLFNHLLFDYRFLYMSSNCASSKPMYRLVNAVLEWASISDTKISPWSEQPDFSQQRLAKLFLKLWLELFRPLISYLENILCKMRLTYCTLIVFVDIRFMKIWFSIEGILLRAWQSFTIFFKVKLSVILRTFPVLLSRISSTSLFNKSDHFNLKMSLILSPAKHPMAITITNLKLPSVVNWLITFCTVAQGIGLHVVSWFFFAIL